MTKSEKQGSGAGGQGSGITARILEVVGATRASLAVGTVIELVGESFPEISREHHFRVNVSSTLWRLAKEGRIERVKRGFYGARRAERSDVAAADRSETELTWARLRARTWSVAVIFCRNNCNPGTVGHHRGCAYFLWDEAGVLKEGGAK